MRTLRDAVEAADADRFTECGAELTVIAGVLDARTPSRVLYVHGPGGIGKSSVLRGAARLAEKRGCETARLDGRTLPAEPDRPAATRLAPSRH